MPSSAVLITGAAGFIGFHVARRLLQNNRSVVGIDNINEYYDVRLKKTRLNELFQFPDFHFLKLDIADRTTIASLFKNEAFPFVVHLAAQAGVRHSIVDPHSYVDANLQGFINILEGCRHNGCQHLIFASSSSVYGTNTRLPFSIHENVDHPISLYAATKKSNELMSHSYSHLFGIPTTGLRFFTVYGPWGRPDMAIFLFAQAIQQNRPIRLFNFGKTRRDFTYIDDVTETIMRLIEQPPRPNPQWSSDFADPGTSSAPWRIYNVGNDHPVEVCRIVDILETKLNRTALREFVPMQPGDVAETCADVAELIRDIGFSPSTTIEDGIDRFVSWFRAFYQP